MAFDSFGNGGGKAWQTPAPAEKPESAAAAGHSLAPTMRVGGASSRGRRSDRSFADRARRRDVPITGWFSAQLRRQKASYEREMPGAPSRRILERWRVLRRPSSLAFANLFVRSSLSL